MEINDIKQIIQNSISVKEKILNDSCMLNTIMKVTGEIVQAYQNDKKVLFCGNGGSAADAQHLAAEFSGRYYIDREPLFAEALHVNTSYLTAVANDYSFYEAYARLVKAFGKEGDVLVAISTSGNSDNIIYAAKTARDLGMKVIGMTGETGGELKKNCNYLINAPSIDTPRIQESHIMIGHIICEFVEKELFAK